MKEDSEEADQKPPRKRTIRQIRNLFGIKKGIENDKKNSEKLDLYKNEIIEDGIEFSKIERKFLQVYLNNEMDDELTFREEHLPTFKEYIKDMSLTDQIKFHYDVDIDNFIGDPWEIIAEVATNPNWLNEFYEEFEENLREREYIR